MKNKEPTVLIFLLDIFSARNFLFTPLWEHLKAARDANYVMVSSSPTHGKFVEKENLTHICWEMMGYPPEFIIKEVYSILNKLSLSALRQTVQAGLDGVITRILRELHVRILFRFNHIKGFRTHQLKLNLSREERYKQYGELEYLGWPMSGNNVLFNLLYQLYTSLWWPSPRWLTLLFQTYRPQLAVIAFPQTVQGFQINLEAQRNKVPVIAYINSWDQPTTKGPIPPGIKQYMVWNEQMKKELIEYHDVKEEKISVVGAAQLDLYYHQRDMEMTREDFFRCLRVDPKRKLIVYGTYNTRLGPDEPAVAWHVAEKVDCGFYSKPAALIIRPHPKDKKWQSRFGKLEQFENVYVRRSSNFGKDQDGEVHKRAQNDLKELVNLMRHADIVLNGAGTLTLDAIAFDTCVINVGFDGDRNLSYDKSVLFRYEYDHYRKIVGAKGTILVKSYAELDRAINDYITEPQLDNHGRKKIREDFLHPFDGSAGLRIIKKILENLS